MPGRIFVVLRETDGVPVVAFTTETDARNYVAALGEEPTLPSELPNGEVPLPGHYIQDTFTTGLSIYEHFEEPPTLYTLQVSFFTSDMEYAAEHLDEYPIPRYYVRRGFPDLDLTTENGEPVDLPHLVSDLPEEPVGWCTFTFYGEDPEELWELYQTEVPRMLNERATLFQADLPSGLIEVEAPDAISTRQRPTVLLEEMDDNALTRWLTEVGQAEPEHTDTTGEEEHPDA